MLQLKAEISPRGERDIVYNFLRDARPDISGFIKYENNSDLIAIEIKNKELEIGDIYQTKRYAELLNAKYALLISTKEIPIEIKRLSSKVYPLLSSGYSGERITLIHFDEEKNDLVEWFEDNPFKRIPQKYRTPHYNSLFNF